MISVLFGLSAFATLIANPDPTSICNGAFEVTAVASHLAGLPLEIREDIGAWSHGEMGDPGSEILHTDAPSPGEAPLPKGRLLHGWQIDGEWFVSYETGMSATVYTIGYVRRDGTGSYMRWPPHYFGGPPCEVLKAVRAGVSTPGGFNF